ncbi:putative Serine/threonine-protein phosphatase PP1 isozyme 8 [Paratrimastix pyriformis]|uniref:Serine/threonine-protein phosphatase n=1 Tax=Paratrimastix pyriformis TaxID=342808 RepID=A0ABQ8URB3_9EUKA|nr:putative Serine/threonine-protein phosphatase PP1 isozyme 8 [Paratrimastix pyriformis]
MAFFRIRYTSCEIGGKSFPQQGICTQAAVSARDGKIYYCLGEDSKLSDRKYLDSLYCYDPIQNTWDNLTSTHGGLPPDASISRASHSATLINDVITIYGGVVGKMLKDDILIYRLKDNPTPHQYTRLDIPQLANGPPGRRGHITQCMLSNMFLFGGLGAQGLLNEGWVFEIETCTWRKVSFRGPAPCGRAHFGLVGVDPSGGGLLEAPLTAGAPCALLYGGVGEAGYLHDCWLYDGRAQQWILQNPPETARQETPIGPGQRYGHTLVNSSATVPQSALLWGGSGDGSLICNDAFVFDLRARRWSPVEAQGSSSICPRCFHTMSESLIAPRNEFHIMGGWAGHRTCCGLWRATLLTGSLSEAPPSSPGPYPPLQLNIPQSPTPPGAAPLAPLRPQYTHYPYPSSPLRRRDMDRVPLDNVRPARPPPLLAANHQRDGLTAWRPHRHAAAVLPPRVWLLLVCGAQIILSDVNTGTHKVASTTETIVEAFPDAFKRAHVTSSSLPQLTPEEPLPALPPPLAIIDRMLDTYLHCAPESFDGTQNPVPAHVVVNICHGVEPILAREPSLVTVPVPVRIFGDIHGQFANLMEFFSRRDPRLEGTSYVFLGDYVDRGPCSVEVAVFLFALKIRYPHRFVLLRGNHEVSSLNMQMGLQGECIRRYGPKGMLVFRALNHAFDYLPFAALVARTVLCLHGGLTQGLPTLNSILALPKPCCLDDPVLCGGADPAVDPDDGLDTLPGMKVEDPGPAEPKAPVPAEPTLTWCRELLWNDPAIADNQPEPFVSSSRGFGWRFNGAVVDNFCRLNGLKLIVRGHEVCPDGFDYFASRKLITVFSATNYGGLPNNGATLSIDKELQTILHIIKGGPRNPRDRTRRSTPPGQRDRHSTTSQQTVPGTATVDTLQKSASQQTC